MAIPCFTVSDIEDCWDEEGNGRAGAIIFHRDHWFVMTPAGLADITTWTITGDAPRITARPSIKVCGGDRGQLELWHGFLTNGELVPV